MTLQEIRDQVAIEKRFINSFELIDKGDWHAIDEAIDEICKRYAIEVAKASLKKASEEVINEMNYCSEPLSPKYISLCIINENNIVL